MGYDYQTLINEMRDGLNAVKRDIAQASAKLGGGPIQGCQEANCLSPTLFLIIIAIQLALMWCYSMYR